MADTTTPRYGLTKPEVGASTDTWGAKLNTDMDLIDTAVYAAKTPPGANTQVIYNNAGAFGANANLTYTGAILKTTGSLYAGLDDTYSQFRAVSGTTPSFLIRN